VYAWYFSGRSSPRRISSRWRFVTGTSAVGIGSLEKVLVRLFTVIDDDDL
jgi:hypothetical protein